jgi:chromate reductase
MLLGLSGALRRDSTNTKLLRVAARHFGGEFVEADLRLPLYDGDLETRNGIPAEVEALADQIRDADAIIISTPEYNQSLSGVLKNALDWVSRVDGKPWEGKPVALMSAAAGRSGGARACYALRLAMTSFRPKLLTGEVLVAASRTQFDDEGALLSERYDDTLRDLMLQLKTEATRS